MTANAWNRALETGHAAIDEQHQQLHRAYQGLLESVRGGDGGAAWAQLQELVQLTERHFAFEESRMEQSSYAALEQHRESHRAFQRDLVEFVERARRDACAPLVRLWLESRYVSWWKLHVRSSDAGLAAHLAVAEAVPPAPALAPAVAPGEKARADRS